nr:hypothetical protein [Tanacetum cinerariifolium]
MIDSLACKEDISYKDSEISVLKRSQIPDNCKKGLGYESYHAILPPSTRLILPPKLDLSNSGLEEFKQPEFEGYGPKTSKNVSEDIPNELKEYPDASLVKDKVSDTKDCSVESLVVQKIKLMFLLLLKLNLLELNNKKNQ